MLSGHLCVGTRHALSLRRNIVQAKYPIQNGNDEERFGAGSKKLKYP